jgi:tetratricopeptide (TPR) repeat protein
MERDYKHAEISGFLITASCTRLLLLFCLGFFSFGSRAFASRLPQTYAAQVLLLDSLYYNQYHGALEELRQVSEEEKDKSFQAVFELYRLNRLMSSSPPEVARRLFANVRAYIDSDKPELTAHAMVILSFHYWKDQHFNPAFEYGLKAYKLYTGLPAETFPLKREALYNLGIMFYYFHDHKSAKNYFLESFRSAPLVKFNQPAPFNILNALGLAYRNLGDFDSAGYCFLNAYHSAEARKVVAWQGITHGNLGITYYFQKRYDEAMPLLEEDIRVSLKDKTAMDNGAKSLAILADIHHIRGRNTEALQFLQQSYDILRQEGFWKQHELRLEIYSKLAKVYAALGNPGRAYQFADSAARARDSLAEGVNARLLAGVQLMVDAEKHRSDLMVLEQQKKMQVHTRNTLIISIILITIIAVMAINRQKMRHDYKQEQLRQKREQAVAELKEAEGRLETFTRTLQEKNELIERFNDELSELQKHTEQGMSIASEHMAQLQRLTILTEEEWEQFRSLFEKVHHGFFYRLREKYPDLSPAEIRYVTLSKLKFSNKEMAGVLGISANAIRTLRSRLRKKLNLPDEENIEKVIDHI